MLNILWEPPLIFAYHNAKAHNEVIQRISIIGMKLSWHGKNTKFIIYIHSQKLTSQNNNINVHTE